MLDQLKALFSKKKKLAYEVTGVSFRESIRALGMETYKGVTVVYLAKPTPIYHLYYKNEFYFAEADTLEDLKVKAHWDIDTKFKDQKSA